MEVNCDPLQTQLIVSVSCLRAAAPLLACHIYTAVIVWIPVYSPRCLCLLCGDEIQSANWLILRLDRGSRSRCPLCTNSHPTEERSCIIRKPTFWLWPKCSILSPVVAHCAAEYCDLMIPAAVQMDGQACHKTERNKIKFCLSIMYLQEQKPDGNNDSRSESYEKGHRCI